MAEEKNFENRVKKFLKEQGAWLVKYWGGAAYTKAGVPDLLTCINGFFVAIEIKASKGKASELQKHTLKEIDEAGGLAVLLYPDDFETFKDMVNLIVKEKTIDLNLYEVLKER